MTLDTIGRTQTAYCSARDRDVRIMVKPEVWHDGAATIREAEIICFEIGDQCTGGLCPIAAVSVAVMAARLAGAPQ